MISYDVPCFFCKHTFRVIEGTPQYAMIKRNMNARHCCEVCRKRIQMNAQRETGMTPELFEALEQIEVLERLRTYEDMHKILNPPQTEI